MRDIKWIGKRFATITICAIIITTAGCGKAKGRAASIESAIVPSADVILKIDIKGACETPIVKAIKAENKANEKNNPEIAKKAEKIKELEKAMGISEGDVVALLISADIDSIDFMDKEKSKEQAKKTKGILAISLQKPITLTSLKSGIDIMAKEKKDVTIEKTSIDNINLLKISSSKPDTAVGYATVCGAGKMILMSLNIDSLKAGLDRVDSGKIEAIDPSFKSAEQGLPAGSHCKLTFLAPEVLRKQIKDQIAKIQEQAKNDPQKAMSMGFITPWQDIKSIAMGMKFAEDAEVVIASDLGAEANAQQISTLIQTMAIPLLKGAVAKKLDGKQSKMADSIKVSSTGSAISISMTLSKDDLNSMNNPPAPVKTQKSSNKTME